MHIINRIVKILPDQSSQQTLKTPNFNVYSNSDLKNASSPDKFEFYCISLANCSALSANDAFGVCNQAVAVLYIICYGYPYQTLLFALAAGGTFVNVYNRNEPGITCAPMSIIHPNA